MQETLGFPGPKYIGLVDWTQAETDYNTAANKRTEFKKAKKSTITASIMEQQSIDGYPSPGAYEHTS